MSRRAFSLVEMIVVLGILSVLLSILMPVVGSARDAANGTLCASHIRTLTQACIAFAADHDGHLPGSKNNYYNDQLAQHMEEPDHYDWLFGQYSNYGYEQPGNTTVSLPGGGTTLQVSLANLRLQLATAPQYGTIWKYVNNNAYAGANLPDGGSYQTYLCPSLTTAISGSGLGSNGRFDYAVFSEFDGAAIKDIPPTSIMHYIFNTLPGAINQYPQSPDARWHINYTDPFTLNYYTRAWSTQYLILPTPLVCQEDAQFNINGNLEGQHAGNDQMAHLHRGGSYYGSPDGSVTWVNEPDITLKDNWQEGTNLWEAVPPSGGTPIQISNDPGQWNWWANQ